jgi:anti-sigma factor RsiW
MTRRLPAELTCARIVEIATEYLDGALPLEDRTRFEQHLVFCQACARYLRQLRETGRLARKIPPEDVPDDVCTGLLHLFRDWKAS